MKTAAGREVFVLWRDRPACQRISSQGILGGESCHKVTLTKVAVLNHTATELEAFIDSGADESLMDC